MPKNLRAISTCLDSLYSMEILECKICNNQSNFFSNAIILKKYKIAYFKCETCGFIQTEYPFWLDEAYLNPFAEADVGLV